MAKIKLNPLFDGISGTLGDVVFKKSKNGEIIISSRPQKSNAEPSEAQKAQRQRFTLANSYAKAVLAKHPRSGAEWDDRPGRALYL
jgi:hypothetical protein